MVRRDFHADVPDALWFTDITQIRTGQGWLYAAVILDAFNREVISWAVDDLDTPRTAMRAFDEAVVRSGGHREGCIIHSDRGYQFTAKDWLDFAVDHDITVSIGEHKRSPRQRGHRVLVRIVQDRGALPHGQPATRAEARARLFHYIWDYNHHRRHSTLGYVAPIIYATESSTCP